MKSDAETISRPSAGRNRVASAGAVAKSRHGKRWAFVLALFCWAAGVHTEAGEWLDAWRTTNRVWRGVHLMVNNDEAVTALEDQLPKLAAVGVNTLILEVNYNFDFESLPELNAPGGVTAAHAGKLTAAARTLGIRLIPQFSCLGHQSWSKTTSPLLTKHPEFDETPGQFPGNTT